MHRPPPRLQPPAALPEFGGRPAPGVPDPERVDPAVFGVLLRRHGWQRRGGAAGIYGRWTPPAADPAARTGTSLLVPESRAFPDCTDLLEEALAALARGALPCAREVLHGLNVPSDEIRWERQNPQIVRIPGRSPRALAVEDHLRAAAHSLLLAGALAARSTAGYYGARHRRQAERDLDGVVAGPSSDGGRLTAYLPVAGGRGTLTRLHHALHAAREAVDYRRTTGGMEAFDAAVQAGVSRELSDALIELVSGSEGARIALAWAPAAGAPAGCAARPEPVEFSPGDLPALREASARYTRDEPSVPVQVTGTVVRMRRTTPAAGGSVRLQVLSGADVPQVRMALDERAYRIAGHAHLAGVPIRVTGLLQRRGGFRSVAEIGDVRAVPLDEAQRDRLIKSMDESLDPSDVLSADD
ncbi:hypothetical protein HYE82_27110 [Streptomyces sp. BR123]|uniref:hypothetical protein n=1 Tax=Streptomyces sp. BR123 TaxID=2749828 RepID=UPI0015C4606B|nr:hypothetical protein [Streptomyces sp. BR123]NXY97980.1 hypothetical protein [Streptomyces sp. BR123]